jgi:hypothetical protein
MSTMVRPMRIAWHGSPPLFHEEMREGQRPQSREATRLVSYNEWGLGAVLAS